MLSSGLTLSTLNTATSVITDPLDVSSTSGEHQRGTQHHLPGISVISEWPHGSLVENVAAKHDGRLIVTVYSTNEIYEIDPYSTKFDRSLLATLPYGPTGIVELDFNHFYINVGSIGQRKTWSIYCLSLHHGIPSNVSIKKLVDIDSALYLNGLCVLSYEHGLLLSVDSRLGHIYKINIQTKQVELWYENDLFKSRTQDALIPGINGIRHCSIDNSIYLTNTDRALVLRLAINPFDYRPKGQLETIVRNLVCDDFTIDHCRTIYATTHAHNSLIRLTLIQDGEYLREDIANINEGLAGATSCVFGRTYRDRTFLYITTTGGNIQSNQTDLLTQTKSVNVISNLSVISPTAKLLRLNIGVTTGLHEPPKRILVACSNHSRGIYLSEFSEPYNILRKKFGGKEGIEFIIASPKGGSIPIDPSSHPRTDLQRDQWSSAVRLLSLSSNPTLDHQYAQDYDAIYLPGGHAPLFDLVDNRSLKQLILDFDTQMKPIVAICHGVVGLVNTRRVNDGNSLIHGRILTGFSLEEELLSSENDQENLIEKSPFILEAKLRDQGAIYLKASPEKEHVVQDGLLLTGQNPASAKQLAYRFVQLLQQCSKHDYQQVNLTSSLPKTLITCHINLSANSNLLNRLKLAHLEYIQRHQHLIVLSGSTLFTDSTLNHTQQDASTMVILLATDNLKQAQEFIENEPYTASKEIFDSTSIKPFKQLFPNANNQLLLNYHIQQELFKSQRRHHHRHH